MTQKTVLLAMAALALAGCKQKPAAPAADGKASGQILEGSISDAMLPLDSVRSQPPLAPKSETSTDPAKPKTAGAVAKKPKPASDDRPTPPPADSADAPSEAQ